MRAADSHPSAHSPTFIAFAKTRKSANAIFTVYQQAGSIGVREGNRQPPGPVQPISRGARSCNERVANFSPRGPQATPAGPDTP